jgi:hypothetical protein
MIPSKTIRNSRVQSPTISLLADAPFLEKAPIKMLFPQWQGESIATIKETFAENPYRVRIGTPNTDKAMRDDCAFFMQSYLSFNPITKQLEKRELISYRNVERVYIGEQRIDEEQYTDYAAFVNGKVIAQDVVILETNQSLVDTIAKLEQQVKQLQVEVAKLHNQTQTQTIYR